MKLYNQNAIEKLKELYQGGQLDIIIEGCLLEFQLAIFSKEGKKYTIVKDKYLNSWSSAYTMKHYNKLPKKYQVMQVLETITL